MTTHPTPLRSSVFALALLLFALVGVAPAQAQAVSAIALPADFAEFAVNPETGDLVGIDPAKNAVVLMPRRDLELGRARAAAEIKVGLSPVSVCYKQFQDTAVYVVACSQQSNVYIIDAEKFELIKKIDTGTLGASSVSTSANLDDPFVYISFNMNGSSADAGVVSLRDMRFHAGVVRSVTDLEVSADGKRVQARNVGIRLLENTFKDDKPEFSPRATGGSTSTQLTDPFGQYVFSTKRIYTSLMQRQVAELPFTPVLVTQSQPLMIGAEIKYIRRGQPAEVTLQAASYNTFKQVGRKVVFKMPLIADNIRPPRYINNLYEYRRYKRNARLIADNKRGVIVFAYRKQAAMIPLQSFEAKQEPLMLATMKGGADLRPGEAARIQIVPADPAVKVEIVDKPVSMTAQGNTLIWKPGMGDIGRVKVLTTLKAGDLEKTKIFELNVQYPSVALPFDVGGLAVNEAKTRAAIWKGRTIDRYGRVQTPPAGTLNPFALIDLKTGKVLAERGLATPIANCTLTQDDVLLWQAGGPARVEVLSQKDLKRKATLAIQGPPTRVRLMGDYIVVKTAQSIELFKQDSLKPAKTIVMDDMLRKALNASSSRYNVGSRYAPRDGVFVGQVMLNETLEPQWIGQLGGMIAIRTTGSFRAENALPSNTPAATNTQNPNHGHPFADHISNRNAQQLSSTSLPGGAALALQRRTLYTQTPGSSSRTTTQELMLTHKAGTVVTQQVLKQDVSNSGTRSYNKPLMVTLKDSAMVLTEGRLYQWKLPEPKPDKNAAVAMSWELKQSAFTLDASGTTKLDHAFVGGKAPIRYDLQTKYTGVEIDRATGKITIDNAKLIEQATTELLRQSSRTYEMYVSQFKKSWDRVGKMVLGRSIRGFPMMLRIQVQASDQDLQTQTQWYYLIVEVPNETINAARVAMEKEREKAPEGIRPVGPRLGVGEGDGGNDGDLNKRVKDLERKIEFLTKQIELLTLELMRQRKNLEGDKKDDARDEARGDAEGEADASRPAKTNLEKPATD